MRKIITGLTLAASIGLAGCATVPDGPAPSTQVTDAITEVQRVTRSICAFVPTAQTVSGVLSAFGVPYIGMASDIASQICAAVTRTSARRGARPAVKGVAIEGRFVR